MRSARILSTIAGFLASLIAAASPAQEMGLEGDTLRTCDNAPDMAKPRPARFAAGAGSGYICIVFKR